MSGASVVGVPTFDRIGTCRVVPVLTVERPEDGETLASALTEGGVTTIELALRTPRALDVIRAMRAAAPGLLLGAGTVLSPDQANAAKAAGADFALSPGLDTKTFHHSVEIGLPFVPGVATASDVQAAVALGCRLLKYFPADPLGGGRGLRILAAPFAHLGVRYLPLGGIDASSASAYLAEPCVAAIGGSWIAPPELIRRQAWETIRQRVAEAVRVASITPFQSS
jgi:2-dehydro-3-deoxyphosphogluconate aldolase/(4S)-4-hydroxy-2-oxoglutarate aldolase